MISSGDFIKIEYIGKDKNGKVFDSTSGEIAHALHGREGPLLIVVGRDMILPGLQEVIDRLQPGQESDVQLPPDKAFGLRSKELIKVLNAREFDSLETPPYPGLQVEFETEQGKTIGTIRSINSGRAVVDFNHPLADHTVSYHVKLVAVANEEPQKIEFLLDELRMKGTVKKESGRIVVEVQADPQLEEKKKHLHTILRELLPGLGTVEIVESKHDSKPKN